MNRCINYHGTTNPPAGSAEELWRDYFARASSPFNGFNREDPLPTSLATAPQVNRLSNYPENFFFSYLDVAFIGLNEPAGHSAIDQVLYAAYGGDINANWINSELTALAPSAIVVFGHSGYSDQVKNVLSEQGATPILYVKGNSHPSKYCLTQLDASIFPNSNVLQLTVEPFKAGPLLMSIVVDSAGDHFFHVEETPGC